MVDTTNTPIHGITKSQKTQYLGEIEKRIRITQEKSAQLWEIMDGTQKKQKLVRNILLGLSVLTSAGFFTFLGLGETVLAVVSGVLTASNTLLSVFAANWKLEEKVDALGGTYSDMNRILADSDYLAFRIRFGQCSGDEVLAIIQDINAQEKALAEKLAKNGIFLKEPVLPVLAAVPKETKKSAEKSEDLPDSLPESPSPDSILEELKTRS